MKKKTIIPLLALVIASCGGGNNQGSNTTTATQNTAADTAKATTTEQPAASATEQPAAPDASIAKEIWYALLDKYDPVEDAPNPSADDIAANRKRVRENSPTNAEFVYSGGGINFYKTLACYKQNNGHWLAIVLNGSGAMNDLTVYDYDGTTITERKNFFTDAFLRRYNISEMDTDGLITHDDNDNETYFRWDGEQFAKPATAAPVPPDDKTVREILAQISKTRNGRFATNKIMVDDESCFPGCLYFTTDDGGDGAAWHRLSCFALSDGGYFVLLQSNEYIKNDYYAYQYADGKLTKIDKLKYLPAPAFDDIFPDAAKISKAAVATIKKKMAKAPEYYNYDDGLHVSFDPYDYEDGESLLPPELENVKGLDGSTELPYAIYHWDGAQFVKQ